MPRIMPVSTAHSTCGYCCRGLAERAVLLHELQHVAVRFGMGGKAVRGERVGDRRDGRLHRPVPFGGIHSQRASERPYS